MGTLPIGLFYEREAVMVKITATSVQQYLAELPDERRAVVSAVRETILFRRLDDVPWDVIGELIAGTSPTTISQSMRQRGSQGSGPPCCPVSLR